MKKVAAYVRISMDATGERWGVETQRRKIAELCSARDWKIFDWYEDNDVSATKPRGPKSDWARMLVDAEAGLFELVVAVDIDRLLRSTRDMNTLMDTGINVATVDGEIDLSTADGEVRAGFLALMARFETRRKSERQLRSNERRRAEGMPASAWPSFGWTKDGKVVPEQAAAVRRAFDAFLGEPSLSIRRIREDLNADGHRTARGSEFSTDAVRYLLGNSLYAGYIKKYSTGELFPVQGNAFQPIVSEQTWRAAVAKLEDNVRRAARQGNQPKYLLSSVGLCGKCGATLVSGTNSRGVGTYKCGEHFHLSRQRAPVDAMVTEAVLTRLSAGDVHQLVMPQEDAGVDREALLTERKALVERIEVLTPLLADIRQPPGKITEGLALAQARVVEIDEALVDRSASQTADFMADIDDPVGSEQRRKAVERKWEALDMDRCRMLVVELMTVTIEPINPGHVKFDPGLIRIEPRSN
ncbi:MAG TPA: recombinase family protein [Ruania sp.]|uniref:Recombinase family protein n=1 Tax=Candidatus Corynebacterium avicola TaxID=2838527 RepID=A0A9D1ULK4_9CORY|nr:recombinase family protein [Candidatus Corynebacterium avicola]HLS63530.1 recombinase family protein [Ruania sp.]